jgi:hypothetical protein
LLESESWPLVPRNRRYNVEQNLGVSRGSSWQAFVGVSLFILAVGIYLLVVHSNKPVHEMVAEIMTVAGGWGFLVHALDKKRMGPRDGK